MTIIEAREKYRFKMYMTHKNVPVLVLGCLPFFENYEFDAILECFEMELKNLKTGVVFRIKLEQFRNYQASGNLKEIDMNTTNFKLKQN